MLKNTSLNLFHYNKKLMALLCSQTEFEITAKGGQNSVQIINHIISPPFLNLLTVPFHQP